VVPRAGFPPEIVAEVSFAWERGAWGDLVVDQGRDGTPVKGAETKGPRRRRLRHFLCGRPLPLFHLAE
jgi:hypothetical protein